VAITAKLDATGCDLEVRVQLVDHINKGIQAGMFMLGVKQAR
jgi:hypothetical protein